MYSSEGEPRKKDATKKLLEVKSQHQETHKNDRRHKKGLEKNVIARRNSCGNGRT